MPIQEQYLNSDNEYNGFAQLIEFIEDGRYEEQNGYDCAFIALSITRDEVIQYIKTNIQDHWIRKLLLPEIRGKVTLEYGELLTEDPRSNMSVLSHKNYSEIIERLKEYQAMSGVQELLNNCNDLLGNTEKRLNIDGLGEYFQKNPGINPQALAIFHEAQEIINRITDDLDNILLRPEIVLYYIHNYYVRENFTGQKNYLAFQPGSSGGINSSMLDVIAAIKKSQIVVWQSTRVDDTKLEILYMTAPSHDAAVKQLHIRYLPGGMHFTHLFTAQEVIVKPGDAAKLSTLKDKEQYQDRSDEKSNLDLLQATKKIHADINKEFRIEQEVLSKNLKYLQDKLEKIDQEFVVDPDKIKNELLTKKKQHEAELKKLKIEKEQLEEQIVISEKLLVEQLSECPNSLLADDINDEYIALAMQKFIDKVELDRLKSVIDKNSIERKKAHQSLNLRTQLKQSKEHKVKFETELYKHSKNLKVIEKTNINVQKQLFEAQQAENKLISAELKVTEIRLGAEKNFTELNENLCALKKDLSDFIDSYPKKLVELDTKKTLITKKYKDDLSGELTKISSELQSSVKKCNDRKSDVLVKIKEFNEIETVINNLNSVKDSFALILNRAILISKLREKNHAILNPTIPYSQQISNIEDEIKKAELIASTKKANAIKEHEQSLQNKLQEIDAEIEKTKNEYDSKKDEFTKKIEVKERELTEARKVLVDHEAICKVESKKVEDQKNKVKSIETAYHANQADLNHVSDLIDKTKKIVCIFKQKITDLNIEIQKASIGKDPIKVKAKELKKPTQDSRIEETQTGLKRLKNKKISLTNNICKLDDMINGIESQLNNFNETIRSNKEELAKSRSQLLNEIEDIELLQNESDVKIHYIFELTLLSKEILLASFKAAKEQSPQQELVACLLQKVFEDYKYYDIAEIVSSEIPLQWISYIDSILTDVGIDDITPEYIEKIMFAINKEFASDGVSLSVKLLTLENSEVNIGDVNTGDSLNVLQLNQNKYSLILPAYKVISDRQNRLHLLACKLDTVGALRELAEDLIVRDSGKSINHVTLDELKNYYNKIESILKKINNFTELRDALINNEDSDLRYRSSLARNGLSALSSIESNSTLDKIEGRSLNFVIDKYLSALREIINNEVKRREALEDSNSLLQEERLLKLEKEILKNDNEIYELQTLIAQKTNQIDSTTQYLNNKEKKLEELKSHYEKQRNDIIDELRILEKERDENNKIFNEVNNDIKNKEDHIGKTNKKGLELDKKENELQKALNQIDETYKHAKKEVLSLEQALISDKCSLEKLKIEQELAQSTNEKATSMINHLQTIFKFIEVVNVACQNDSEIFEKRNEIRKLIADQKSNTINNLPTKANELFNRFFEFESIKSKIDDGFLSKLTAELEVVNDPEILYQLYAVILNSIKPPVIEFEHVTRKIRVTGYNLSWNEVSNELEGYICKEINKCGLSFKDGSLSVDNVNYLGSISDLPNVIRTVVEERIELNFDQLSFENKKSAYGEKAKDVIKKLNIDYYDILKSYVDYVEVIAGNTLKIESDMKLPGISVLLYSRSTMYCKENLVIDTSGRDASQFNIAQAPSGSDTANGSASDGRKGLDGLDGLAGVSAGDIFIKSDDKIENLSSISCMANGGNGASGQQGGDGEEGFKGKGTPDAIADDTTGLGRAQWRLAKARIPGVGRNGEEIKDEKSGNGGAAGLGGLGGSGGHAGEISISDINNRISSLDVGKLELEGDDAKLIKNHQMKFQQGITICESAKRGKGGEPGKAGEVGLDHLIVKKSFWKKTKERHGYYDESVFESYKQQTSNHWTDDIFGVSVFIDTWCNEYSVQYRLLGTWLKPPLLGSTRIASSDKRSMGKQGECSADKTKDVSTRKKSTKQSNNTKNAEFNASVKQIAVDLAHNNELEICQNRCQKYTTINEGKVIVARAIIEQCKIESERLSSSCRNLEKQVNTCKDNVSRIANEREIIHENLKVTKDSAKVINEARLSEFTELAELKSKLIEARATLSCTDIDIEGNKLLSARLEQSYNRIIAISSLKSGLESKIIADLKIEVEQLLLKTKSLKDAQDKIRNEMAHLKSKGDIKQHKSSDYLEITSTKEKHQETTKTHVMVRHEHESLSKDESNASKYSPHLYNQCPQNQAGHNETELGLNEEFIIASKKRKFDNVFEILYDILEIKYGTEDSIQLIQQYVNEAKELHIAQDDSSKEEFCKFISNIKDFTLVGYVIENAINHLKKSSIIGIANDDVYSTFTDNGLIKQGVTRQLSTILLHIILEVAQNLRLDDRSNITIYRAKIVAAIKALSKEEDCSNIVNFLQSQYYELLIAEYKEKYNNNYLSNFPLIINEMITVYNSNIESIGLATIRSVMSDTSSITLNLSGYFECLKEIDSRYNEVCISIIYNLVDWTALSEDQLLEYIARFETYPMFNHNDGFRLWADIQRRYLVKCQTLLSNIIDVDSMSHSKSEIYEKLKDIFGLLCVLCTQVSLLNNTRKIKLLHNFLYLCNEILTIDGSSSNSITKIGEFKTLLINEEIQEFKNVCGLECDSIYQEFLTKLHDNRLLINYFPQYLFHLSNFIQDENSVLSIMECEEIERCNNKLKNSLLHIRDMETYLKLTQLSQSVDSLLASWYLRQINDKFETTINNLEKQCQKYNDLDKQVEHYSDFYNVKDPLHSNNKRQFIKLLLAKLIIYDAEYEMSDMNGLLISVNKHAFAYLQKKNLFSIESGSLPDNIEKNAKKLREQIDNSDIEIVTTWTNSKGLIIDALQEPNNNIWLEQYLIDSYVLFSHIIIDEDKPSVDLAVSSDIFKSIAVSLEGSVITRDLRIALDNLYLILQFAAYKKHNYLNIPQYWQNFTVRNIVIDDIKKISTLQTKAQSSFTSCFNVINIITNNNTTMASLTREYLDKIGADENIDTVIDQVRSGIITLQKDEDDEKDVINSSLKLLHEFIVTNAESDDKKIDLTKKINLNMLYNQDKEIELCDDSINVFLRFYKPKREADYSFAFKEQLNLLAKNLAQHYLNKLIKKIEFTNSYNESKLHLEEFANICQINNLNHELLEILSAVMPLFSKEEKPSLNEIECKLDFGITKICENKNIKCKIGEHLVNSLNSFVNNDEQGSIIEWMPFTYIASKSILSDSDIHNACSKVVEGLDNDIADTKLIDYIHLSNCILQLKLRNMLNIQELDEHAEQSIKRLSRYILIISSELINCISTSKQTADENLTIKDKILTIQKIAEFLLQPAADDFMTHFLEDWGKHLGRELEGDDLALLLNDNERIFKQVVTKDILVNRDILPNIWEETLKNKFISLYFNEFTSGIHEYIDSEAILIAFNSAISNSKLARQEYELLQVKIKQLLSSNMSNIKSSILLGNDIFSIIDAFLSPSNINFNVLKLKKLISDTIALKQLLISTYVNAAANRETANWVSCILNLSKKYSGGMSLEELNYILLIMESFNNQELVKKILDSTEANQAAYKLLIESVYEFIDTRGYSKQEKINLYKCIKQNFTSKYNKSNGYRFIYLLLQSFYSGESISAFSILDNLKLVSNLNICDKEDIIEQLEKIPFTVWGVVLRREYWQSQVENIGIKGKYPALLDRLISLEKRKGDFFVSKIFQSISKQPENRISLLTFNNIIKGFTDNTWDINDDILQNLDSTVFSKWEEFLNKRNISDNNNASDIRTTSQLIDIMRSEPSTINLSVKPILDKLEKQVQDIENLYESLYLNNSIDNQKKHISEIVEKCKSKIPYFLKDDEEIINHLLAAMCAVRAMVKGNPLRNTQILALLCFINGFDTGKGRLGNIFTGEGKSDITVMLAVLHVLRKQKVDIITSSNELAIRDANESADIFDYFDIKVSNNCDEECSQNESIRRDRYHDSDVIYGDIGSFQRDYLLSNYMQKDIRHGHAHNLIVDEVDSMCIDNADRTLYISHRIEDLAHLKEIFIAIWHIVANDDSNVCDDNKIDRIFNIIQEQRKNGTLKTPSSLDEFVNRRLKTWISNAYYAKIMKPGSEYSIPRDGSSSNKIVIMDLNTGTEQLNSQWCNGLHQFLQLKHSLVLSNESLKAIFISNMNYLRKYSGNLYGSSGTLGSDTELDLLSSTYNLDFFKLPRYKRELYKEEEGIICDNTDSWLAAILNDVQEKLSANRIIDTDEKLLAKDGVKQTKLNILIKSTILAKLKDKLHHLSNDKKSLENECTKYCSGLKNSDLTHQEQKELIYKRGINKFLIDNLDKKHIKLSTRIKKIENSILNLSETLRNYTDVINNNTQRAVLIIAEDQNSVSKIEQKLINAGLKDKIKRYDSTLKKFKVGTLYPGDIVIATNIAGRGTDFKTSNTLNKNGGLFVIGSYMAHNIRNEIQMFGRTARQGCPGTAKYIILNPIKAEHDISVEFMRDLRDSQEAKRLADFTLRKNPKIDLEDELFKKFANLQEEIISKLEGKQYKKELIALQINSLGNHWAFFLDEKSAELENVYKTGDEKIYLAYSKFENNMRDKLNTKFGYIYQAGELLKLARYYFEENDYSAAERCYDEIIATESHFCAFAHYYKVLCIFGNETEYHRKEEARTHLKHATRLFEDYMSRLSTSGQAIKYLSESKKQRGEGGDVDEFTPSNAEEISFYNIHLRAAQEALGSSLSPSSFASGCFTENDSKLIWGNIREKQKDIIKDYRVSKKLTIDKNDELYYKDKKINFPNQLDFCKTELLKIFSTKIDKSLDERILPANLFDQFILTKAEFIKTLDSNISKQDYLEVIDKLDQNVTGLKIWLDRDDIKQFFVKLDQPISEDELVKQFSLSSEQKDKLIDNLISKKIIRRYPKVILQQEFIDKLTEIFKASSDLSKDFLGDLKINLPTNKQYQKELYEKVILDLYNHGLNSNICELPLPDSVEDVSNAYWSQLKDLSIVKFPSVKFPLTRDPEKRLDEIQESLKGKLKEIFKDVADQDEAEKMEDSIYSTIESAIGKIKTISKLKIDERDLEFYFKEGKIPPKIVDYMISCCDIVLSLKKDSGWWDWDAFLVATIGIIEIAAGVVLSAAGLEFIGEILIDQGIGDIMFAAQSMAAGNFSWKAYGENKLQKLFVSIATFGISATVNKIADFEKSTKVASSISEVLADTAIREAVMKKILATCIESACTVGVNLAVSSLAEAGTKVIFSELKQHLKKEISIKIKQSESVLIKKINHLYTTMDSADVDRIISATISEINLEKTIRSRFSTKALDLGQNICSQLNKLAGADRLANTKFANPTLALLGTISESMSKILTSATVAKTMIEIGHNVEDLLNDLVNKFDEVQARFKSQQEIDKHTISEQEVIKLSENHLKTINNNLISQIQSYFEHHLVSVGITKALEFVTQPTIGKLTKELSYSLEDMQTARVYEKTLKDISHGVINAEKNDINALVDNFKHLKSVEILTPEELLGKEPNQKVLTESGEDDLKSIIERKGSEGMNIIHRNGRYILVEPDYTQFLENMTMGKSAGLIDLEIFAAYSHRSMKVSGSDAIELPVAGFDPDMRDVNNQPIELRLNDKHYQPVVNGEVIDLPNADSMPDNSCAAQSIVYMQAYEKARNNDGLDDEHAKKAAYEYASKAENVQDFITHAVKNASGNEEIRNHFYSGAQDKYPNIIGGHDKTKDYKKMSDDFDQLSKLIDVKNTVIFTGIEAFTMHKQSGKYFGYAGNVASYASSYYGALSRDIEYPALAAAANTALDIGVGGVIGNTCSALASTAIWSGTVATASIFPPLTGPIIYSFALPLNVIGSSAAAFKCSQIASTYYSDNIGAKVEKFVDSSVRYYKEVYTPWARKVGYIGARSLYDSSASILLPGGKSHIRSPNLRIYQGLNPLRNQEEWERMSSRRRHR